METNSQNRKMAGRYQCRLLLKFQGKKWNHIARDSEWKALINKIAIIQSLINSTEEHKEKHILSPYKLLISFQGGKTVTAQWRKQITPWPGEQN